MINRLLRIHGLAVAWALSILASAGSLYFSEVVGYVPCQLCWFQRVFMFPLTAILGIANLQGDRNVVKYALPLSVTGGIVSLVQFTQEKVPVLGGTPLCGEGEELENSKVATYRL